MRRMWNYVGKVNCLYCGARVVEICFDISEDASRKPIYKRKGKHHSNCPNRSGIPPALKNIRFDLLEEE